MLRRLLLLLPAVLLIAGAAHAGVPGPTPQAIITAMYDRYQADPDTLDDNWDEPPFFAPDMEALYIAGTQDRGDEMPVIDWDVFVNGQDSKISHVRIVVKTGVDTAVVTARFKNFGKPQTVTYDFVALPEGWRCADLHYPKDEDFPEGFSLKAWITEGLANP